ncbi:hypothetical protein CMT91_04510 [Elizabethkingia anophelis]|nr:hypothetical protein [Elizabethkingia anophelis]
MVLKTGNFCNPEAISKNAHVIGVGARLFGVWAYQCLSIGKCGCLRLIFLQVPPTNIKKMVVWKQ